jgi:tripartite-type tricarboxylate transporter receptor subunit TctC
LPSTPRWQPGQVSIASAGNGSSNHLAIELLMRQANLKLLHVPYKGSGPALTDLIGSQVQSMMDQLTASIGHIKEGRIRAIAISSAKRSQLLPEVPTLDELGVKGYEAATFTGIFAPAGVSSSTLNKLNSALRKALAAPAVRERYQAMGVEVMDMPQGQFDAYVRADFQKWQKVARDGNIAVD